MDNQLLINTQLSHAEAEHRRLHAFSRPHQPQPGRRTVIFLAVCMALQMTSFVLILPLFARRFSQLGAGVQALGESAMAYALAATIAAPFMGALADRFGRRRVVLVSLGVYVLAFTGYLLAPTAGWIILLRGLAGAFTAGLIPAILGTVADIAPADRRAQWIGIVNGGASVGWIAGPILGGFLYDRWGFTVALSVSILLAAVTFLAAFITVPETHKPAHSAKGKAGSLGGFKASLTKSPSVFLLLLWISFAVMFAWAFIEPRSQFYAYDDLGWSSSQLGLVMSVYGISMTLGEFGLGRLSDRWGRKPVILLGLVLFSAQFLGLAISRSSLVIGVAFFIAGLGNALYDPAISASILDLAPAGRQASLLGIKSTAGSLGNIIGPALIVLFTSWLSARGIFLISFGMAILTALLTLVIRPRSAAAASPANSFPVHQGEIDL